MRLTAVAVASRMDSPVSEHHGLPGGGGREDGPARGLGHGTRRDLEEGGGTRVFADLLGEIVLVVGVGTHCHTTRHGHTRPRLLHHHHVMGDGWTMEGGCTAGTPVGYVLAEVVEPGVLLHAGHEGLDGLPPPAAEPLSEQTSTSSVWCVGGEGWC